MFANVALGDGTYQRTRNGKALVWNNDPSPGDEASWSGGRDREGYASGFGTLTWYTVQQQNGSAKPAVYARYWGNMVRGKFNGPVNAHSKGRTNYAIFSDGVRTTRWVAGPAPSRASAEQRAAIALQTTVPESSSVKPSEAVEPEAPAEAPPGPSRTGGPSQIGRPSRTGSISVDGSSPTGEIIGREESAQPSGFNPEPLSTTDRPKIDIDDSLRLLVWPPRSLRMRSFSGGSPAGANPGAAPPPATTNARLTKEEVVDLADAEARSRGYDLTEYQRPEPQYDPSDQTWSLFYDQTPVDGTGEIGKYFSVAVDDKTKRRVLVPGK